MDIEAEVLTAYQAIAAAIAAYGLRIIGAFLIIVVGWVVSGWVASAVSRGLTRFKTVDETLRHFGASAARYAVLVIVGVMVLEKFGVQTASLIAVIGAAGLAIGLALQGTLSNVAAGVMLLAFRPFKVGDYIEVGSLAGSVKNISLFVTEMATPDNVKVICPNNELWNKPIRNYSVNPTRRLDLVVGISYADDPDRALAVVREIVEAEPRILKDPEPLMAVQTLGESSVDLLIRVWSASGDFFQLKLDLTKTIKQRFDAEGISIPFPQREVRVVQEGKAAAG